MRKFDSPEQFEAFLWDNLLSALRHHCTDDDCSACPYGSGPSTDYDCNTVFIENLPDRLRYYGDEVSLDLAVNLEACQQYEYDLCSKCDHFTQCYAREDLSFILKETYDHLVSLGIYSKRYNPFNYSSAWVGILFVFFSAYLIYRSVIGFMNQNILYGVTMLLFSFAVIYYAYLAIQEGRIRAYRLDQNYLSGKIKSFICKIRSHYAPR